MNKTALLGGLVGIAYVAVIVITIDIAVRGLYNL